MVRNSVLTSGLLQLIRKPCQSLMFELLRSYSNQPEQVGMKDSFFEEEWIYLTPRIRKLLHHQF
ncbi:hypothetical protein [Fusobacterium vincentii ATCC 49256]|uniref:Uncharacterized protein n=1 Tax=Fusobacterium vincentii ATCC 49256 TaxID=209882 RepID=Q7P3Q7_FUSVC|nr:hypothetical protein [Fusobacterium vincentii ATCC 49256]